jgi:zinc D-Ala-D-Ala dipeptidase
MFVRRALTVLLAVVTIAVALPVVANAEQPTAPPEFVALDEVDPTILHDIRYHEQHNFVGRRVHDYYDPICVLTRPAAAALAEAQQALRPQGYTLKVYDCYRPQTAVDDFVRWARRLHDDRMKPEFYPRVDKSRLFADGYIAERSGHSRGSTVDLTLVRLPARAQPRWRPSMGLVDCAAPYAERFPDNTVDMGTGFDCFDTLSHTLDPRIQGEARENRLLLRRTLEEAGFRNYEFEWWHYTLRDEPFPETFFDFPVSRRALL